MRKLIFAALMLPALAHSAVYKCTGADGKVGFSDRPCVGAESVEAIHVRDNHIGGQFAEPSRMDPVPTQRRAVRAIEPRSVCRDISSTQVRTMVIRNQVVVGMKRSDALRAWGTPWSINGSQHAYHWERGSAYFYVEDGCVRSVQGSYVGGKFVK